MPASTLPAASKDDSHGLWITGGSRGLTVEYRELQSAAGTLDEVSERLRSLKDRGVGVCRQLYGMHRSGPLPEPAGRAAAAVDDAVHSLRRIIDDLEDAAKGLRKAVGNYLDVEGRLETAFNARPVLSLGAAAALWRAGGWGYPSRTVTDILVPQYDGLAIDVLLTLLARGSYGKLRPVSVRAVDGNPEKIPAPGTAHALLSRSRHLQQTQQEALVEVLSVRTKEGKDVRVVTLPGTQPGAGLFVGGNPFDQYGNAEGRTEDSKYVAAAVAEALRQAGTSADDAVILVGYSQGGIHAVNTGARLAEEGEFDVEMILTAGAPAGDRDVPEDIKVLHFEHGRDWVAGADGASNPDTPDRITVTGTAPLPEEGGPLGPAHELDGYLEMAARADESEDPSLQDSLGHLAAIIGPGTIATRSLFRFSRSSASSSPGAGKSPAGGKPSGRPGVCLPQVRPPVPGGVLPLVPPAPPVPVPAPVPPVPVPPPPVLIPFTPRTAAPPPGAEALLPGAEPGQAVPEYPRGRWLPAGPGQ